MYRYIIVGWIYKSKINPRGRTAKKKNIYTEMLYCGFSSLGAYGSRVELSEFSEHSLKPYA